MRTRRSNSRQEMNGRLFLAFTGVIVMCLGIVTLLEGKLHYQNYWHGLVFAPFALLVGALIIFAAAKGRGL